MMIFFKNAKVYVNRDVFAEAVLVDGDRIVSVGSEEAVTKSLSLCNGNAEMIDCEGRTLVPGFNDSHMHLFGLALNLRQANLSAAESVEDVIDISQKFMEDYPERVARGLYAAGWNQDYFDDPVMPLRRDMDRISTDIPVCLERACGHIVVGNSKLIEIMKNAGIRVTHEEEETGIFREDAGKVAKEMVPGPAEDEIADAALQAMKRCAMFGVTSVQSNDAQFVFKDHGLVNRVLDRLYNRNNGASADAEMGSDFPAPIRYRQQISFESPADFIDAVKSGVFSSDKTGLSDATPGGGGKECVSWLYNGPLKLFTDGSLGARTAHMRNGYADDPGNYGVENITFEEMEEYCVKAKEAGVQVVAHGIGDGAVEKIVDVYEKVFGPENPLRCGIIHCQITDAALLKRIADLNIPTFVQPIFLDYDIMMAEDRCGRELASTSYAFKTLSETGHMAFGTDCPVEDCNPFDGIYCAVTRKRKNGQPEGGWNAHECVDVYAAVDAYTIESAYMEFAETYKGRIKEGYLADMVLLDRDIFTIPKDEIKDIKPVLTMTGGKIVFEKG